MGRFYEAGLRRRGAARLAAHLVGVGRYVGKLALPPSGRQTVNNAGRQVSPMPFRFVSVGRLIDDCLLWRALAPSRMALAPTLNGIGPVTLREFARRVGRDVHSDGHLLLKAGVLRKDDEGRIEFPYTAVSVDFMLKTAK